MTRRAPALVRAEILARVHFGLRPIRPSLTTFMRGVHRTVFAKLEADGFMLNGYLTEQAYLELKEVCRRWPRCLL